MGLSSSTALRSVSQQDQYIPRGRNELHTIFEKHFADFCEQYDERYGKSCGMYPFRESGRSANVSKPAATPCEESPGFGVRTRNVATTISDLSPARDCIYAPRAVRSARCCSQSTLQKNSCLTCRTGNSGMIEGYSPMFLGSPSR